MKVSTVMFGMSILYALMALEFANQKQSVVSIIIVVNMWMIAAFFMSKIEGKIMRYKALDQNGKILGHVYADNKNTALIKGMKSYKTCTDVDEEGEGRWCSLL